MKWVQHKIWVIETLSNGEDTAFLKGTATTQFQISLPCKNVGLILPDVQIFKRK